MKKVIVKGIAGLGNRLITLTAAMEYGEKTNRKVYIDWTDGMYGPLGENVFGNYFTVNNDVYLQNISKEDIGICYPRCMENYPINFKVGEYFIRINKRKNSFILNVPIIKQVFELVMSTKIQSKISKYISYFKERATIDSKTSEKIFTGGDLPYNLKEDTVMYVDFEPPFNPKLMRDSIKLNHDIEKQINEFMNKEDLFNSSLGIHIRNTDKRTSADIDKLIKYLPKFCCKHNIKKIFLATDDWKVEEKFQIHFGEMLVVYPKELPTVSKGGIHHWSTQADNNTKIDMAIQSIMDMFILSKSEYLFIQGGSSFGEISYIFHHNHKKCFEWTSLVCKRLVLRRLITGNLGGK